MIRVRVCTMRCRCHSNCRRSRFSQLGVQIFGKSSFNISLKICCASSRSVLCLRTRFAQLGRKSLGCPVTISRSGGNTIWEASKLGGPDIKEWLQSRKRDPSRNRFDGEKRKPTSIVSGGRPMTRRKKQIRALRGTAVAGAQAPREGFTAITSGRSRRQQGLVATCRDSSNEA
jgi:hypothetical protein